MKKERIKSIVLVLLVFSNFALGGRIWINEKLWPDGYNFFANIQNSYIVKAVSDIFDFNGSAYVSKTHIIAPDKIIVNTGYQTTRFALNANHEMFKNANDVASEILSDAMSSTSKMISPITEEQWYSVLSGKSMYLVYNIEYDTSLFSQFLGIKGAEISSFTDRISDIVISADNAISPVVYIRNSKTGSYFKISTSASKNKLESVLDYFQQSFDEENSAVINYSFDLLFDKAFGNQKVILNSMIPIFNNPQKFEVIESANPMLKADNTFNSSTIDKLLNIFDINPTTMSRYTEANGTIVFVENDAILKLSPEGVLEYNSKLTQSGVKLANISSAYNTICLAADFMDEISAAVASNKNLYISSDLTDDFIKNETMNICFDYRANGIPVSLNTENLGHAVNMQIENGYLKNYVQIFRTYSNTGSQAETPLYIEALDKAIQKYSKDGEQLVIEKLYTAYRDDGSIGLKNADWEASVSGY
ncbi:MAG: hypothetical protein N2171_06125 [Clostridia bacterium]|nr:hypothetical protein [Clostridia bacterium]